jgi:Fic family protein
MYVRKEALLSSQIEGTQSSFADLMLFEHDQKTQVAIEDVEEVSHYVEAINYGLKRIKELGGKTLIQEPHDAAFAEMPASALKLFTPDKMVTLKKLAQFLENL